MKSPLRILHLENNPDDVDLVKSVFENENVACRINQVISQEDFLKRIKEGEFDVILADNSLPAFTGLQAMELAKQSCPDVPFIIVSGAADEHVANESLKYGATGFIPKDGISKLVPFVERAVQGTDIKFKLKDSQNELKEPEEIFKTIANNINVGIFRNTPGVKGKFIEVNPAFVRMFGYDSKEELLKLNASFLFENPEDKQKIEKKIKNDGQIKRQELKLRKKNGEIIFVSVSAVAAKDEKKEVKFYDGMIEDVTDRIIAEKKQLEHRKYLDGKVKELNCLQEILNLMSERDKTMEEILQSIVEIIPSGWQYPEITCSKIDINGNEFKTGKFKKTLWKQSSIVVVFGVKYGNIDIYYLKEQPKADEGPFLKTERDLIDTLSREIGRFIERKKSEEALRESEERFKIALKNSRIVVYNQDKDLKYTWFYNPHLGFPVKGVNGLTDKDILSAADALHLEKIKRKALKTGKGVREAVKTVIDNQSYYYNITIEPLLNATGEIIGITGASMDITQLKSAEAALKMSEEKYRLLFERNISGVYKSRIDGKILECNQAFANQFRFKSIEEALSFNAWNFYDNQSNREEALNILKKTGKVSNHINRLIRKDGSRIWVLENSNFVYDEEIKQNVIVGTVIDITQRILAEESLRDERDMAKNYLDIAGVAIILIGIHREVKLINKKGYKILGYKEEEIIGKEWFHNFVPKRFCDDLMGKYDASLENARAKISQIFEECLEYPVVTKKGEERVIKWYSSIIHDKQGNVLGMLSSGEDITEQKRAEEELKASLKEKKALLSEVHHRVKNNMQVITSLLSLQSASIKDKKIADMFNECQRRIKAMALVHDTLYRSQNFARVDLGIYVKGLVNKLYHSCNVSTSKIDMNINIQDISLTVGHALPFGLIINELVSNAFKYAFPPGYEGRKELSISAFSESNEEIVLIIEDTGAGIPKEIDYRNTKSMGLHLVTLLAEEQLHSKITLDRTHGTKFTLIFKGKKSD